MREELENKELAQAAMAEEMKEKEEQMRKEMQENMLKQEVPMIKNKNVINVKIYLPLPEIQIIRSQFGGKILYTAIYNSW